MRHQLQLGPRPRPRQRRVAGVHVAPRRAPVLGRGRVHPRHRLAQLQDSVTVSSSAQSQKSTLTALATPGPGEEKW